MVEQLQAAKRTGEAVDLAVSDAIGAEGIRLEQLLSHHGLSEVTVITFPEGKLRNASARLRKGLGMGPPAWRLSRRATSRSTPMSSRKVFPGDTQWAIAGKIAAPVLEETGRRLPTWLHGDGQRVVTGKDGFAALLVFGGPADYGDDLAAELARRGPVYLLDFDDEAPSIKRFTGTRTRHLRGYPPDFLEERGIIAPGYEPSPPSPVITAGVVEGITPEEARRARPKVDARFAAHPRGVLVTGDAACGVADDLTRRRKLRSFTVFFNPKDRDFSCVISEPGKSDAWFTTGEPNPTDVQLDSILGETTVDGILRVLGIPRELLP
jgi:hypothetical protein